MPHYFLLLFPLQKWQNNRIGDRWGLWRWDSDNKKPRFLGRGCGGQQFDYSIIWISLAARQNLPLLDQREQVHPVHPGYHHTIPQDYQVDVQELEWQDYQDVQPK